MHPSVVSLVLGLVVFALGCERAQPPAETAAYVQGVVFDHEAGSPVVVLRERDGIRRLPIWIGLNEAHSIAARLDRETPPRPNTHDLAKRLVEQLAGTVQHVVVTDLRNGVYFARIHLAVRDEHFEVDARPSDAIALALRCDAPIFVRERLFRDRDASDRQVPALHL